MPAWYITCSNSADTRLPSPKRKRIQFFRTSDLVDPWANRAAEKPLVSHNACRPADWHQKKITASQNLNEFQGSSYKPCLLVPFSLLPSKMHGRAGSRVRELFLFTSPLQPRPQALTYFGPEPENEGSATPRAVFFIVTRSSFGSKVRNQAAWLLFCNR